MKKKIITHTESSARALLKKGKLAFPYREVKDEDIDCSDIPELTDEQLKLFKPLFRKSKVSSK